MDYRIKHITHYQYSERVSHCYNLAYMTPRETNRQQCHSHEISITPSEADSSSNVDYFGNHAYHFEILRAHKKLTISCESTLSTAPQDCRIRLNQGATCLENRQQLSRSIQKDDLTAREYLLESAAIPISEELRDYAAQSFSDQQPLLKCVMDLTRRIFTEFKYSPQSTTIATPLSEVLATKKGVCQDFAHLQIACLRALGYPARYVSGYLETLPPPGEEKLVGADATHAWLAVYSIDEGWVEFDPTNNCLAGEQHIVTAFGRDYFDVTPLKGVIYGGGDFPTLTVSVDVRADGNQSPDSSIK